VVQHDADGAIRLAHEGPSLVDGGYGAFVIGEVRIPLGGGEHAMQRDDLVAHAAGFPRFDGKPFVVGIVGIATNKASQGAGLGAAKVWGATVRVGLKATGPYG
jgi:hypothetical protein